MTEADDMLNWNRRLLEPRRLLGLARRHDPPSRDGTTRTEGEMPAISQFSEAQKQAFVDRAAQIGVMPAMRELGYPGSKPTAHRWVQQMGVKIELSALQQYAASVKKFYGHQEKMAMLHRLLDETYDILVNGEKDPEQETVIQDPVTGAVKVDYNRKPVSAAMVSRLVTSVQRIIQTIELLEGRATERSEVINPDSTDVELASMIRQYKAKNAVQEQELRGTT